MRTLIVHDYLDNVGGGEKLMLSLARSLGADFATLDANPVVVENMGFEDVNVVSLGDTFKRPPLKQIHASAKYLLRDLGDYDAYVFSGNWSHYAAKKHAPNLWYCHTPVRAFYTDRSRLASSLNPISRTLFHAWTSLHSRWDQASVKDVEHIVANSENTRARISKYYDRDAQVIYPGIDTAQYGDLGDGGYWLSVNRLYPEKRVDLQARAFKALPKEKLVVVGSTLKGDHSNMYAQKLIKNAPENVTYRGRVSEKELIDLYGRCRGFICTAYDEDFGMTPVEAMASGKPVIAVGEGGYVESVVDGETGILVEPTSQSIASAVKRISEDPSPYSRACRKRAKDFDLACFTEAMKERIRQI